VEHVLDILNLFIPSQVKAVQSPSFIIFLGAALSVGCVCCDSHGAEGNRKSTCTITVAQSFCNTRIAFLMVQYPVLERGKDIEAVPISRM